MAHPPVQGVRVKMAICAIAAAVIAQRRATLKLGQLLSENKDGSSGQSSNSKMVVGTGLIFAFDKVVAAALRKCNLKIPSSLASMVSVFVLLKLYERGSSKRQADRVNDWFRPAVDHLGKWMTLYLTPPLVVLPLALRQVNMDGATMRKMGVVHVAGWAASLVSTTLVAKKLIGACRQKEEKDGEGEGGWEEEEEEEEEASVEEVAEVAEDQGVSITTTPASLQRERWRTLTAVGYFLIPFYGTTPALASTTILALLEGNNLPKKTKRVLHPLLTASVVTGVVAVVVGKVEGKDMSGSLSAYFSKGGMLSSGPGDFFFGFLNASCAALGFRVFQQRELLRKNLVPLVGTTIVSSMASLWGTCLAGRAVGLPSVLSITLAQRSVMSSLGIPAAQLLGGNDALAVASILVTGLYGASLGQTALDAMGVDKEEAVERGVVMGATAHSIGTASLMEKEPSAAAIASVALCLAGVFHTSCCSIGAAQRALKSLA